VNPEPLTESDLGRLTGRTPAEIERALGSAGLGLLPYRELTPKEASDVADAVETVIREESLRVAATDDATVWERGWREVADRLARSRVSLESLRPQYYHADATCRLFGRYIRPLAPGFEYDVGLALRRIAFAQFLGDAETIVEFGCGTGLNLLLLAELFPKSRLIGCDWATPSRDILAQMARETGKDISGRTFNMLDGSGWSGEAIDRRTSILTVHAMEQLGTRWQAFAEYLAARRPGLCLHIEPILEFYDPNDAFDGRARRYHSKRHYLEGFYPYLAERARAGAIEILEARRVPFGGLYHEAYSLLAWRPVA
jgi:SAM-dependent methyltransferase